MSARAIDEASFNFCRIWSMLPALHVAKVQGPFESEVSVFTSRLKHPLENILIGIVYQDTISIPGSTLLQRSVPFVLSRGGRRQQGDQLRTGTAYPKYL